MEEMTPPENMDPMTPVMLAVHSAANANKTPTTRWGVVKFDAKGDAELKVPFKDVSLIDSLGWLSDDDRAKYLGAVENDAPMEAEAAALTGENDALKAANTKLASRVAELEAAGEALAKKYDVRLEQMSKSYEEAAKAQTDRFDAAFMEQCQKLEAADKALAETTKKLTDTEKALVKAEKKAK